MQVKSYPAILKTGKLNVEQMAANAESSFTDFTADSDTNVFFAKVDRAANNAHNAGL